MKLSPLMFVFAVQWAICAFAAEVQEENRVNRMNEALRQGGIGELLKVTASSAWEPPAIPSRWRIERTGDATTRKNGMAARELGGRLIAAMSGVGPTLAATPVSSELYRRGWELAELARWIAKKPGYGNGFVAQRAADLAAIVSARITVAGNNDVGDHRALALMLDGEWLSPQWRSTVLNAEVGEVLFNASTQNELSQIWDSTNLALIQEKLAGGVANSVPPNRRVFFEDGRSPRSQARTSVEAWEEKRHERIARGLETENVLQALALLRFREEIGHFPEKPVVRVPTEKEREAMEWQKKHFPASVGKSVSASSFMGETKAAFAQAWEQKIMSKRGSPGFDLDREHNAYIPAWIGYTRVKDGTFVDSDTARLMESAR